MAKKYLIPGIFILLSLYSVAQHCRWDGSSFIMLDIKGNPSVKVQKIYLLDSTGAIVLSKHYFGDRIETDTAEFWKNPPKDAMLNPSKYRKQYFSFAKDYYVLEFGQYNPAMPFFLGRVSNKHSQAMSRPADTTDKNEYSGPDSPSIRKESSKL